MDGYQQSDDPNRNWKKVGLFIIAVIIIALLLGAFFGCNPEKKIQRQDNAAIQRVLAKNDLLTIAGGAFIKIHPCIPIQGKEGKTTTETKIVIDTAATLALKHKNDSLFSIIKKGCPQLNVDSLKQVWQDENSYTVVDSFIYKTRVDTVPDLQAINLLNEKISQLQHLNDIQVGQILAANDATKIERGNRIKYEEYLYGSWGIVGIILLVFLAIKIFGKATPVAAVSNVGGKIISELESKIK